MSRRRRPPRPSCARPDRRRISDRLTEGRAPTRPSSFVPHPGVDAATLAGWNFPMTAPYPATALEPEVTAPLILALPKGRILAECGQLLARAGVTPAPDYADEESRRLRFPDRRSGARRGAGAAVRRRHLRRIRRGATRHLRRRRADGVRLPGDLRAARSRHRPVAGSRSPNRPRPPAPTIPRAGRACGWRRSIPTSPAGTSPRAACMPMWCT